MISDVMMAASRGSFLLILLLRLNVVEGRGVGGGATPRHGGPWMTPRRPPDSASRLLAANKNPSEPTQVVHIIYL